MKIGVIGASGFIGKAFCEHAIEKGHEVVGFSRSAKASSGGLTWRHIGDELDVSGLDAIVNYAGESVAQRWSEKKKVLFRTSRVNVTEAIVTAVAKLPEESRPRVLINTSAVGYYGDCDDHELDEQSAKGEGFLADLCLDWEQAAVAGESLGLRVVLGRVGLVLGKGGAAWEQMKTAFSLGAGGPLGNGKQWMPWVEVRDVAAQTLFCIEQEISGPVNFVGPNPVKNSAFTKALGRVLQRPAFIPAPEFALKMMFGEFGKHLLDSYRVYPKALEQAGYEFIYPDLEACLKALK